MIEMHQFASYQCWYFMGLVGTLKDLLGLIIKLFQYTFENRFLENSLKLYMKHKEDQAIAADIVMNQPTMSSSIDALDQIKQKVVKRAHVRHQCVFWYVLGSKRKFLIFPQKF